jgi:hypothetical protein
MSLSCRPPPRHYRLLTTANDVKSLPQWLEIKTARMNFRAVRVFKFRLGQNNLVAVFQRNDGLLPIRRLAGLRGALAAALPRTFSVLTRTTLTLNSSCTAWRICGLFARRIGHDGVLIEFFALPRAFFRQADGLDDFKKFMLFLGQTLSETFFKRALRENNLSGRSTS